MRRIDKNDIGELLKYLEQARHQLINKQKVDGVSVSSISWIQKAISDAIIYIQLVEQELYQSNEGWGIAAAELCEVNAFLRDVFGRDDIVDFCTDNEKAKLKKIISENEWQDPDEEGTE